MIAATNDLPAAATATETDATLFSAPCEAVAQPARAVVSDAPGTPSGTPEAEPEAAGGGPEAESADATAAGPAPRKKRGGGPRTQAGRDRSRWNSTKHSLTATTLYSENLRAAVEHYTKVFTELYLPVTDHEKGLIAEMAKARALKEHANHLMVEDMIRVMERAESQWDLDRQELVEKLGARLHKDMRIAGALARTKHGAEWLLERWARLRWPLDLDRVWTDEQRSIAFDLMGIEAAHRDAHPLIRTDADVAALKAVLEKEVGRLRTLLAESLLRADQVAQESAKAGMPPEADATTRNLRKHENRALRELERLTRELLESRALAAAAKQNSAAASPAGAGAGAEAKAEAAAAADAAAPASAARGTRRPAPAPTPQPQPVPAADAEKFASANDRWYYDTVMRETASFVARVNAELGDDFGDDDGAGDEELAAAMAAAAAAAMARATTQTGAGVAANPTSEEAAARAREERERRRCRAEERRARNKARRKRR